MIEEERIETFKKIENEAIKITRINIDGYIIQPANNIALFAQRQQTDHESANILSAKSEIENNIKDIKNVSQNINTIAKYIEALLDDV